MNDVVIKANNLTKHYKQVKALDGVNFEIQRGQIIGLLGPNGAGKTTLIKSLLGLSTYKGDIDILGLNPQLQRPKLMEYVSFIADVAVLPRWLEVIKALQFVEGVHPKFNRQKAEEFLGKTEINLKSKIHELSKGMIVQLHLALVMAIDAQILVLDEPTLGLDIMYRKQFYQQLLNGYYDKNRTIIITTHQVDEIESILSHVIMINHGKIVLHESMETISHRYCAINVPISQVDDIRKLNPIDEQKCLGDVQFIFESGDRAALEKLGECKSVPVSDIFVAKITKSNSELEYRV